MPVNIQVAVSVLVVVVVLAAVWRMPRRGDRWFGWAPPLALGSAWTGLLSVLGSALLWVLPVGRDVLIALLFLLLIPGSLTAGLLVYWIYRGVTGDGRPVDIQIDPAIDRPDAVSMHRMQAGVGLTFSCAAIAIGYAFALLRDLSFVG